MKKTLILITTVIGFVFLSCDSKPVKVEPLNSTNKSENIISNNTQNTGNGTEDGVHKVTIVDSLATSRYVYLEVKEGNRKYWISTWKMPFKKGDVFYYKGGILKLNFFSKEHNTYFDTLYLISKISKAPVFTKTNAIDQVTPKAQNNMIKDKESKLNKENITSLSQLFSSPEKYKNKIIEVGGKCTKVNINIMGKNWIHIQEKDSSGKTYNLVVTSKDSAKVGENCYFEGKIDTKLDLGAGYFFDIIMQEGKRIY